MLLSKKNLNYEPLRFLRCHSKNNDIADSQKQVWDCAFEPSGDCLSQESFLVATCGGNSVCFINCDLGKVLSKYYTRDPSVLLFSLSWTKLMIGNKQRKLLVTGGSKATLYLIDYSINTCILEYPLKCRRSTAIHALYFHQSDPGILFCGTSNGEVRICELTKNLNGSKEIEFVMNNCTVVKSEVFDFTFCSSTNLLLSACNDGIITFYFPSTECLRSSAEKKGVSTHLMGALRNTSNLVDSVEVLKDGLIACKYALHSCIYICDLKPLRDAINENKAINFFELEPLYSLKWSSTNNYFMRLDANIDCSLLCCGDDEGSLWLYSLKEIFKKTDVSTQTNIEPSVIIPWPHLTDHYSDKKRKLNLDVYDIVIDKVVVHSSGEYMVAVTNNNLVCIWKKTIIF